MKLSAAVILSAILLVGCGPSAYAQHDAARLTLAKEQAEFAIAKIELQTPHDQFADALLIRYLRDQCGLPSEADDAVTKLSSGNKLPVQEFLQVSHRASMVFPTIGTIICTPFRTRNQLPVLAFVRTRDASEANVRLLSHTDQFSWRTDPEARTVLDCDVNEFVPMRYAVLLAICTTAKHSPR